MCTYIILQLLVRTYKDQKLCSRKANFNTVPFGMARRTSMSILSRGHVGAPNAADALQAWAFKKNIIQIKLKT